MKVLSLSTLDPDVENFEEYLECLSDIEFSQLLTVASMDSEHMNDDDFIDISALSVNLYSTEMDIDPLVLMEDTTMLQTIMQRFLSSIIIFSLIKKDMVIKSPEESITLYRELSFEATEKGHLLNQLMD